MKWFDRAVVSLLPLVPRPVVRRFSRPYIAGEDVDAALAAVRRLNAEGAMATLDVLGEHITRREQAETARDAYLSLISEIRRSGIDSNVSIKLTQIGLKLDLEFCFGNIEQVVAHAAETGMFVRIDMEDSSCTDDTLAIFHRLRRNHGNVGVVLQAMLRRTAADAESLASLGANVRLCKGIYVEPRRLAWQERDIIRRNYADTLEILLRGGSYVGIATHDEMLVWEALRLIRQLRLEPAQYEFQMLLGVEEPLRRMLIAQGHRLRVYVPFGRLWYAYSVRRLRENPRIAGYVARAVLGGRAGGT